MIIESVRKSNQILFGQLGRWQVESTVDDFVHFFLLSNNFVYELYGTIIHRNSKTKIIVKLTYNSQFQEHKKWALMIIEL